jgi:predicted nucleotidyltransferase
MSTLPAPTQEQMARYRATARRQEQAARDALVRREEQAWGLARQAAALLRAEFHVETIVVFGSLVHPGFFTRWSDVDLAARGLDPRDTLRVMEMVRDLSAEIPVNLVDLGAASDSLRRVVEREGQPL